LPRRRRLCFWQSCSWQVVKQSAVFLLGAAGGRTRRTAAANDAFYERVKASVEEVEATTQDEALPVNPVAVIAQTQQFKQDVTRHSRRSIHHYCLIGRNLNTLERTNELTDDARRDVDYCPSYIRFLINLYKFSVHYPKIKRVTIGIRELKTKFKALKEGVATEPRFWRTI